MSGYWDGVSSIIPNGYKIKSDRFEYTIRELINDGASITYKAKRNDGKKIFLKQFREPNSSHEDWNNFISFQKSILNILLKFPPNVVEINYEYFEFGGKYKYHFQAKALETGMTLEEFINNISLNFAQKLELSKIIVGVIKVVHEKGVVHSDLKPAQIFMVKDSSVTLGYRPKLVDFDHCIIPSLNLSYPAGTDLWKSPEHIKKEKITFESDIFTLGLIIFYILTKGKTPFNPDNYDQDVLKGAFIPLNNPFQNKLPQEFANTIDKMLSPNKKDRPSIEDVHKVFVNFDKYYNKATTPKYLILESNSKSAIILNTTIITREFVKSNFGNHKNIYKRQFELRKDSKGEWYISGFDVPKEGKDRKGNIYQFFKTFYNSEDITNKFVKVEDKGKIKVGNDEFITKLVY